MEFVAHEVFRAYKLPHGWSHLLPHALLTNEYHIKISSAYGLEKHINGASGKNLSADGLEVLFFSLSLMVGIYFRPPKGSFISVHPIAMELLPRQLL
jgi:hypothetical protein